MANRRFSSRIIRMSAYVSLPLAFTCVWRFMLACAAFIALCPGALLPAPANEAPASAPSRVPPSSPPASGRQLVVAVAADNNTNNGILRMFTRTEKGWRADSEAIACLFGKNGMAWGRGLHAPQEGLQKQEKDGRTPAGRFKIGKCLGQEDALPKGATWPYQRVTERDAWVDDPTLPHYNQHVRLGADEKAPAWFEKQRMKIGDFAYHWLLVIEHNTSNIVPGAGSAIFFHIRRGETRPTAGCTTMARGNLERLLVWIRPAGRPEFVVLSKPDYLRLWKEWQLPDPEAVWGGTKLDDSGEKSDKDKDKDKGRKPAKSEARTGKAANAKGGDEAVR
ncbi:hypothetical protein DB346_22365 [Verrucomicrobia bacterium LW23]|nr:hypothetical protein DB346_22365 [Verrucomicrobia bacterium LW23]